MEIIKWRDSYETGIKAMDDQHRKLIDLINQLYRILREKEGFDKVKHVLEEMGSYAESHLRDEESLLEQHGYPQLAEHKQGHQAYFSRMEQLLGAMKEDRQAATQEVYAFLRQWWINHIVEEDKQYGTYLQEKGIS